MALPDLWRHFLRLQILPNEDKADELRDEYLKCAARRGITDARVTVFKGLDKLCKAPEAIKGLAKTVSELGRVFEGDSLQDMPTARYIKWIAQSEDKGPGLKIIQHAHPATNIPTINNSRGWDANEEEGRAAVLGFVIDEEHQRALIREISISQDDLNRKGELIRLVESADDKSLVSAAIGHLVAAIKTPGPLDRKHFNRFNVIDGTDAQNATGV